MSFSRYPEYKDSGLKWIGEIPIHWHTCRAKTLFANRKEIALKDDAQLSATQKYGVVPQSLFMSEQGQKVTLALSGTGNFRHVQSGDFVISLRSFQGGLEYSKHTGCVSPAYIVLKPLQLVAASFFRYLLKSTVFISYINIFSDGIRDGKTISYDQFSGVCLSTPPIQEQSQIARFLDHETAKIDTLIREQERLIELLKEKRQAVISHAVTKGLYPDAPMKDSGVEWLGEVPEGWEVKRLKHLGDSIIGLTYSPADIVYEGTGTLVLRSSNVQGGKIVFDDNVYVATAIPVTLVTQVGDILICSRNGSRALIGKNAMIDETSAGLTFGAFMTIFRSQHSGYISCVLNSPLFEFQSGAFMTSTINQLTIGVLNNFEVPFPPTDERERIVKFLETETAKFDVLTAEAQRAIDLLQERRSALISAAVTGKIDVRNWQPSSDESAFPEEVRQAGMEATP